jgi:hypothetical protein
MKPQNRLVPCGMPVALLICGWSLQQAQAYQNGLVFCPNNPSRKAERCGMVHSKSAANMPTGKTAPTVT